MSIPFDEVHVRAALANAWSPETAAQWTAQNPASGQCNVTAAVVYDLFGGEILRTRLQNGWHYYNRIDGIRTDLTDSQFKAPDSGHTGPVEYQDESTDKATALATIPDREYEALTVALLRELGPSNA